MKTYDVMTQDVQAIGAHATIEEAARMMADQRVGFLPVVEGGHAVGVLTDRDIVLRVVSQGMNSRTAQVVSVMTPNVVFVYDDQPIEEAVEIMCREHISRLLVKNRSGAIAGLLSSADIAALAGPEQIAQISERLGEGYWESHLFASS
jgi:CBS domain-containing protein